MASNARYPIWLTVRQPGARAFALLFLLESFARASLSTIIPVQAYALFGSKETMSIVYTLVALTTFATSFAIPFAIRQLSRRWAYSGGVAFLFGCTLLLAAGAQWAIVAAMLMRTIGSATMGVTLNLYIMDNIRKQELVKSEPMRLGTSTLAWAAGPALGIGAYNWLGPLGPVLVSAAFVGPVLGLFWYLRLSEAGPIRKAVIRAPSPIGLIRRFSVQPRLRLAWVIGFARSCYWTTAFVYIPVLMIEGGRGSLAGAMAVSAANLMLFNNLVLPPLARRYSVRRMLGAGFITGGGLVAAAGLATGKDAGAAAALMVAAAFFVSITDGLGVVPFMRAVRVHERAEMTTIYRTYLDMAQLIPPLVFFFVFQIAGFGLAFILLGVALAATGWLSLRFLPARM